MYDAFGLLSQVLVFRELSQNQHKLQMVLLLIYVHENVKYIVFLIRYYHFTIFMIFVDFFKWIKFLSSKTKFLNIAETFFTAKQCHFSLLEIINKFAFFFFIRYVQKSSILTFILFSSLFTLFYFKLLTKRMFNEKLGFHFLNFSQTFNFAGKLLFADYIDQYKILN